MRRGLLAILFVVSGAAALCYEVAWTRHLVLVFGNTTRAVALLLGAYMLGLALGSEAGGRLADRSRRPALLYAAFEGAIALFALAFPWLVDGVRAVHLTLGAGGGPVLFVLAFLLLVVPTFCMGTTLPLLVRATVDDPARTGRDVGFLYAANIVGAVVGAAGTGFVLMEAAGVLGATRWAAAANAAVGVVGWLAFRGVTRPAPAAAPPSAAGDAHPRDGAERIPDVAATARRAALVSAFAAGFVGLAAQVAWTRLLTFFLQGFTWTFTAILSTFLTGLALGGWVFGRRASVSPNPARLLVRLHLAVAVAAAAALWALGRHYDVTRSLWIVAGGIVGETGDLQTRHRWMLVLASGVVLLVPSFLMGGCFPVATALSQRGLADLGSRVGRLYAVNTVGCVLGSLVAGFVLQPWFGPSMSAAVVAAVALAAAVAVANTARVRVSAAGAAVSLAAFGALLWAADPSRPWLLRSHAFAGDRGREVVLESTLHGEVCTVSVVRNTRERYDLLYTDEFQAAGTKPEYRYMRMLAHLPVALARDPSRTLVICFGTGTTAGSVATHGSVTTLDIVEISPEVLATAGRFRDVNRDVLHGAGRDDLDVRVHVDDGRHFVLASDETWGVLSLEPLMPYTPAAIHFYTRDFYETCRGRLAPGGLMCQWIPLQGMSGDDFRRLVAAFVAVFPESAMFFSDGAVALVGGPDGVELSWARVSERLSDPRVAEDLRAIGYGDPVRALSTFVTSGERLREFVEGVPPVTDEFPVLEFHPIPPGVALPWLGQNLEQVRSLHEAWDRPPVDLAGAPDADAASQALVLATRASQHVLKGLLDAETAAFLVRLRRTREALEAYGAARNAYATARGLDPGDETARRQADGLEREWWSIQAGAALDDGDLAQAERHLRRALEHPAQREADAAWTMLAEVRNRAGRPAAALEAACEATRLFPGGRDARAERAFARAALGDVRGASEDYRAALRGEPVATLPDRLRQDAERVRAEEPWEGGAPPSDAEIDARVRAARGGEGTAKIPARLVLRIVAADRPDLVRAAFADALAPPAAAISDETALRRIADLRLGAPEGAAATLAAWIGAGRSDAVARAAAEALVELDPERATATLAAARTGAAALSLCRAAASSTDLGVVEPLLRILLASEAEPPLRVAARDSLFALLGERAPHLATLDPSKFGTTAYRNAVLELAAWWVRERDGRQP